MTSQISQYQGKEESMTLGKVRKLFDDCQMLPVMCPRLKNKPFLQTMMSMPSVIKFETKEVISSILFKLGCMKLDTSFFFELDEPVLTLLNPELLDTRNERTVLDFVFKLNHSEFCNLSHLELNDLQMFLQSGASNSKNNPKNSEKAEYQRKLKSLPIFETLQGKRVSIDGSGQVFIINGMETFSDLLNLKGNSNIFLKNTLVNEQLSNLENFQIQMLSDLQYFVKFILPGIHTLSEAQLLCSIKMLLQLQNDLRYHEYEDKIISTMTGVKLIKSIHGNLEMASYYFDEDVELYKLMLPQEKFVPQRFWDVICETSKRTQARQLLCKLGMKHAVSNKEIIDFAYQIESESKGKCELGDLQNKSSKLLQTTIKKAIDDKDQTNLDAVLG